MTTIWKTAFGADPLRAIGAWMVACYVAGVAVSLEFGLYQGIVVENAVAAGLSAILIAPFLGFLVGLVVAFFTAIPALILTGVIRAIRWPRPFADMIGGGGLGAALIVGMSGMAIARDGSWSGWLTVTGFALAGAISGWVYWRVAGRPRPHDPLPQKIVQDHVFD
ncbi:hypothetical protein [Maricaulis maris]|uniref:hypothetical protein n=1 Tax=Maricaulis maris TaxID=74318 RepID=UPI0026EBF3C1|nr:hypothetical protein [Maricaulis maris]